MLKDSGCNCVEVAVSYDSNGRKYAAQLKDALKEGGYKVAAGSSEINGNFKKISYLKTPSNSGCIMVVVGLF